MKEGNNNFFNINFTSFYSVGCVLRFEKDKNTEFSHTLVKAFDFYKINGMEQNVT